MENVIKIIEDLRKTGGTNDKISIIKKNANNKVFTDILKYTYDDNLQYGFSENKLRNLLHEFTYKNQNTWVNGFDMLNKLAESNINDSLRNNVLTFLSTKSYDEQELWINVLTKDLRCNISSKTINKAVKGLINTWEVQQAYPIDKAKLKKGEWIALSLKLNGIRSTFFKDEFRSRQNKPMLGYNHIKEDIQSIEWLRDYMVDGELIRKNVDNVSDNENFRLTTSIVNSDAETKPEVEMVIFDIVPNDEFVKGESSRGFKERLDQMKQLQDNISELGLTNIRVAPTYYTGTDHSQINILLNKVDSEGYEGLMCIRDDKYKCKRHKGILKCKKFKEGDFKIIGFNEGEGKYKNTLGSLVVEFKENSVGVSGFTEEMRDEFWNNKDKYLNTIITVKYKEESKDKDTGLPSLQFPTFVCLRPDKTEPNY